jgi:tetratricopeptide (TPR) repeat protein
MGKFHIDLSAALLKTAWRCMPDKPNRRTKKPTRREIRDLDIKVSFLEGLVRRDPSYVDALQILGDHYTKRGQYDKSLVVDQQLSKLEPANSLVFYNLACSYSLNQEYNLAATALEKAISLGYRDFKWLARDPDLSVLRKQPCYQTIAEKIRQFRIKIS